MPSVTEHYETHLAPVYVWMAGGFDAALARGRAELDAVCPRPTHRLTAVDLGAGFGMHTIPLADLGYDVLAIDNSPTLLAVLDRHVGTRAITAVRDDLCTFTRHLDRAAALILCMGDTLTHLPDQGSVQVLIDDVAAALAEGGTFITTFRDYSTALTGPARFIPVRADADRILTCFLEYEEDAVTVHDILHERKDVQWRQRVSAYRKLRLSPAWVIRALRDNGLHVTQESGPAGMVRMIAKRPWRKPRG